MMIRKNDPPSSGSDAEKAAGTWVVDPATGRKIYQPNLHLDDGKFDARLSLAMGIGKVVLIVLVVGGFVLLLPYIGEQESYIIAGVIATIVWRFRRSIFGRY